MNFLLRLFAILLLSCVSPLGFTQSANPSAQFTESLTATIHASDPAGKLLHGVYVEQHGNTLVEQYFTSGDKEIGDIWAHETIFNASTLHDTRSISKSVISLLIGIALNQGKIVSLDTPVVDILKNISDQTQDAEKRKITLRDLLKVTGVMGIYGV
jgi:CubicO group peptidase (beta-lactamase class C family)